MDERDEELGRAIVAIFGSHGAASDGMDGEDKPSDETVNELVRSGMATLVTTRGTYFSWSFDLRLERPGQDARQRELSRMAERAVMLIRESEEAFAKEERRRRPPVATTVVETGRREPMDLVDAFREAARERGGFPDGGRQSCKTAPVAIPGPGDPMPTEDDYRLFLEADVDVGPPAATPAAAFAPAFAPPFAPPGPTTEPRARRAMARSMNNLVMAHDLSASCGDVDGFVATHRATLKNLGDEQRTLLATMDGGQAVTAIADDVVAGTR